MFENCKEDKRKEIRKRGYRGTEKGYSESENTSSIDKQRNLLKLNSFVSGTIEVRGKK